jgi:hypothetical protein
MYNLLVLLVLLATAAAAAVTYQPAIPGYLCLNSRRPDDAS